MKKRLPTGIQTFREIREGNYYYIDKTPFAYKLVSEAKYYFLSRPRRFGKSLFLDTLKELFEGNEPLFRDLFIHGRWDWQTRHPVIRISFGAGTLKTREELELRIRDILAVNAKRLNLSLNTNNDIPGLFGELISSAAESLGAKTVILIDEYDKPILDNIENTAAAAEMCEGLKNLYSVIKDCDADIRFAFLTGVSKFSKVSIFSGLNNLTDITLAPAFSAICGYTENDLDEVFAPELPGAADRQKIREWYNGYNWLGEPVYNPYDLLLYFYTGQYKSHWFETGTPTFLIKLLKDKHVWLPELGNTIASEQLLSSFDVDCISPETLMFQAGYLTIAEVTVRFDETYFRLRYPNREVFQSTNSALLKFLTDKPQNLDQNRFKLWEFLAACDLPALGDLLKSFFASIPYQWHTNNNIDEYEGYYASVFYAYFASLGLDITPEESSCAGRLDMAVRCPSATYLFEFKVAESSPEGRAIDQLKSKGYAQKHLPSPVPVFLVGIEFSKATRNLVSFEHESLATVVSSVASIGPVE